MTKTKKAPVGSVIHGATSCGNVYRILMYAPHETYGELCLLRVEQLTVKPIVAIDSMEVGSIIARFPPSFEMTHQAKDCPNA